MLVVAESFYFPKDSTVHLDAAEWYQGNQQALSDEEVNWMHCRGLMECGWNSQGHAIYRAINSCLAEMAVNHTDRPISSIAFMNTFQRPSLEGDTFRRVCTLLDRERAKEALAHVIRSIKPDMVIVASKYAWDAVGHALAPLFPQSEFYFTCHPASPWHWNRISYAHGRSKFINILIERFCRPGGPVGGGDPWRTMPRCS